MSERGPAEQFAAETEARASARVEAPVMTEMLDSLAADYKAGKLPDDVKEQIDALRDEYLESLKDRGTELKSDLTTGIDGFIADLKTQVQTYEADGGSYNSEVMDSRLVPVVANFGDGLADKVHEPVIDAVEDVVHDVYSFADDLLHIRAEHDPEGIYAAKLSDAEAELDRVTEKFDASMDKEHEAVDHLHDAMDQMRTEAEEFHQTHAPVQLIMSTTVDPNLPEQMAEETGEGSA